MAGSHFGHFGHFGHFCHFCHFCHFTRVILNVAGSRDSSLESAALWKSQWRPELGFQLSTELTCTTHVHFRNGIAHLFSTLDGNNKQLLLSLTVCETESKETWQYFGEQNLRWGLGRYVCRPLSVVMHDRMKGIEAFMKLFPEAIHLECFRHIIGNIYTKAGGRKGLPVELLWQLRKVETFENWMEILGKISDINYNAAWYVNNGITAERSWRFNLLENGVRTHNRTTSQSAEGK